jgi:hypothetical protein
MGDGEEQLQRYRDDAALLARIGVSLSRAELPEVEVRLPEHLARAALAAWERDERGGLDRETFEQRIVRHRAAALALIGLAVSEHALPDGDEVIVRLPPGLIGSALDAADDLPPI